MAVVWDEVYDPLDSAYLGPEEAFDKQGHHIVVHHHHYHQRPHSQSLTNGGDSTADHETNTTIIAAVPWTPPSDICESKLAYHIDVEVPGVMDINPFQIQWLTPRTLLIDAKAKSRSVVHRGSEEKGKALWEDKTDAEIAAANTQTKSRSDGDDGGALHRCANTAEEKTTRIVLEERRLRSCRRSFTLPVDVDLKTAKVGVEFGLLRISVLKKKKDTASNELVVL